MVGASCWRSSRSRRARRRGRPEAAHAGRRRSPRDAARATPLLRLASRRERARRRQRRSARICEAGARHRLHGAATWSPTSALPPDPRLAASRRPRPSSTSGRRCAPIPRPLLSLARARRRARAASSRTPGRAGPPWTREPRSPPPRGVRRSAPCWSARRRRRPASAATSTPTARATGLLHVADAADRWRGTLARRHFGRTSVPVALAGDRVREDRHVGPPADARSASWSASSGRPPRQRGVYAVTTLARLAASAPVPRARTASSAGATSADRPRLAARRRRRRPLAGWPGRASPRPGLDVPSGPAASRRDDPAIARSRRTGRAWTA